MNRKAMSAARGAACISWTLLNCTGFAGAQEAAETKGYETGVACQTDTGEACVGASEYFIRQSQSNTQARQAMPLPDSRPPLSIGLALAGGGTRASQFSIGVMKGLHEAGVLDKVNFLSTVSGGSYAGYWYMAQRIEGGETNDLFRDCVPYQYSTTASELGRPLSDCTVADVENGIPCLCPTRPQGVKDDGAMEDNRSSVIWDRSSQRFIDPFRYQNNLRTHPDLFVPGFNTANTASDNRVVPTLIPQLAVQLAVAGTVDLIGDVLFDWNVNSSPSRALYRDGIQRIYGLPPVDCARLLNAAAEWESDAVRKHCLIVRDLEDELPTPIKREPIRFDRLARHWQYPSTPTERLPYWIINATTPVLNCPKADGSDNCVVREVFSNAAYPPHKAAFEFSLDYWGAGEFGYWDVQSKENPFGGRIDTVVDAVASSAAFFDPLQRSFMLGGAINSVLQLSGFRWGYYIANPHVSQFERHLHRALPFPLYLAHRWRENKRAVDIHLIDGGQSENLGAYALIRRRVPNIILSDHASEDRSGNMEDICQLKKSLALDEFVEWNEGRIWHIHFDDLAGLDQVCNRPVDLATLPPTVPQTVQGYRYNVHAWPHPVLRGCAVELKPEQAKQLNGQENCETIKNKADRDGTLRALNLFLIKPTLNVPALLESEGQSSNDSSPLTLAKLRSEVELRGFLRNNVTTQHGDGIMLFPTHNTVNLTIDSSPWLFGAYRELGARAARALRVQDGQLVVVEKSLAPLQPLADYQVDHDACHLTQRLAKSFGKPEQECTAP